MKIVSEIKERCGLFPTFGRRTNYFFEAPESYDEQTVKKRWKVDTPEQLAAIAGQFETVEVWEAAAIKEVFSTFMNEKQWNFGAVMNPLRLSLVGSNMGPDLFRICEILGKEETNARINRAIKKLS